MVKPEDGPAETNEASSGSASGLVKPKPAPAVSKGYAHLFKYIIVGDSGTGKSALLRRYTDNEFQATHLPTIGVDFAVKSVSLPNGDEVKLQVTSLFVAFFVVDFVIGKSVSLPNGDEVKLQVTSLFVSFFVVDFVIGKSVSLPNGDEVKLQVTSLFVSFFVVDFVIGKSVCPT
ncbi:hypothetical protein BaRGS_00013548, partial [Batillaria attramentaria]